MAETTKSAQSFACGQLVSIFSMASLVMAKLLVMRGVSAPAFLNCCFYIALSIVCLSHAWRQQTKESAASESSGAESGTPLGSPVLTPLGTSPTLDCDDIEAAAIRAKQRQHERGSEPRWWFYLIVAFFDLQANCLAVRSLAFTDYVSAGLMLNLTIPFVSLLSCIAYDRKYSWGHVAGCTLATLGGAVLFLGSYVRDEDNEGSQQTYGCLLALLAAFMYGAANITNQLYLRVQSVDSVIESLGMVGAFGSALAMVQMLLLERAEVSAIEWDGGVSLCVGGYILAMFAFYMLVSLLPQTYTSPLYNLSMLASNLYLAFASYYLFAEKPQDYFFVALLLVLVGLTMHCVEHSRAAQKQQQHQEDDVEAGANPSRRAALLKPQMNLAAARSPVGVKLVAIQIEHAAL